MSAMQPISRTTLSEQVTTQIAHMISAGKWKPGEKLPSEPEFCRALDIGRSTLREALKSLAFLGIVEMRHGEGTYVAEGPSKILDRIFAHGLLTAENVNDLCEARLALESELAVLCAQRATEEDLRNLEDIVKQMKLSVHGSAERFQELDLQFHLTMAACSKSRVLAQLLRTIRGLLRELIVKSQELPDARELACAGHLEILEALKQHNPRKARSAIRNHIGVFQRRYKMLLKAAKLESASEKEIATAPEGTSPRPIAEP